MMKLFITNENLDQRTSEILLQVFLSLSFVYFIGCVDEGLSNPLWVFENGEWKSFLIFSVVLFGLQRLTSRLVTKDYSLNVRLLISLIGGVVGFALLVVLLGILIAIVKY